MQSSKHSRWASLALGGPVALVLIAVCIFAIHAASQLAAWQALFDSPGLMRSIGMTLWTGLASALSSWLLMAWLVSQALGQSWWAQLVHRLAPMLAVPHAAFAVGLVFLIAPSGWLFRSLSPWLTGWEQPPQIATSQDSFGLGLIAMLVLKEVPFLLFAAATQLQRDDTGARWQREALAAQTMGYSRAKSFWLIIWPQLSTRLRWPLLAVLAYSLTVVDASLIAGPGTPTTLSVRAWQWLQDSDAQTNAVGATAAWLLMGLVLASVAWLEFQERVPVALKRAQWFAPTGVRGVDKARQVNNNFGHIAWLSILAIYVIVLLALAIGSVSGVWPFPSLLPNNLSFEAWASVGSSSKSIVITLVLGLASSTIALLWSVAWLELSAPRWDAALRKCLYLPLLLPSVLWVVGLHRIALQTGLTGTALGILIAHLLTVLPYTLITLSPAYSSFDPRYEQACAALGKKRGQFLMQVKWPLLRQSLWSAMAVGFAVSVAQFLPTLYVGEGRFVTVTTEAVTLSSGGQRSLVAAFAWLQWFLPAVFFAWATWAGKPRKFQGSGQ
jgi:putative thiamine transport system permease protein